MSYKSVFARCGDPNGDVKGAQAVLDVPSNIGTVTPLEHPLPQSLAKLSCIAPLFLENRSKLVPDGFEMSEYV